VLRRLVSSKEEILKKADNIKQTFNLGSSKETDEANA